MYAGFRSHCLQDYPEYELLFAVSSADDEAVADVERLKREFPDRQIQLIVCPEFLGTNGKVSNLAQAVKSARYDFILVNDSDIRVEPDYLRRLMAHFADEKVGMVTALYRAHAGDSFSSRIEAVTIGTDFAGGVLSAYALEGGLRFALGSTLAIRRSVLDRIGGFDAIVNHLADDYELGHRTSRLGYQVALTNSVVETYLPGYGPGAMFRHQLRWARTIRDMRKFGYIGVLFTFALPWAILAAVCASFATWSVALLSLTTVMRFTLAAFLCGPVLHDVRTMRDLWLVPIRDFIGVAVWAASFVSDTVDWRGEKFHLKDGILRRK